ncbi:nucleoside/nucleotide kinase family protein [Rhodobacteraceae bacterium KN286]|uniref:Nucleoside/nucleotide kinase family protein n=2 Tax=Oceanomicrobium pacificus TaxID=2692916 RepID=A0A6B0TYV1_9RHOB|nr:nucleoside/nucleotide kinase family protein [Oceanomicrobium pacificus]
MPPAGAQRTIVAIAGAPGSGKSTLAARLGAQLGDAVAVVPMDGFHYDNALLERHGLIGRKGAPDTFDAAGFVHLVRRLKAEPRVAYPTFDRAADLSRAAAAEVTEATRLVLVEGNYLLLRARPWSALADLWDFSVMVSVPVPVLRQRLLARWAAHGLAPDAAQARAEGNDLPNARTVIDGSAPADLTVRGV